MLPSMSFINEINKAISLGLADRTVFISDTPATIISYFPDKNSWSIVWGVSDPREVTLDQTELVVFADLDEVEGILSLLDTPIFARAQSGVDSKSRLVEIPEEVVRVMYVLTNRPDSVEYGGGLDFEVIQGKDQIERMMIFLGAEGHVPSRVVRKYSRDVEVAFHTHPSKLLTSAFPSAPDLVVLSHWPQEVQIIVSREDMMIMTKLIDSELPFTIEEAETILTEIRRAVLHIHDQQDLIRVRDNTLVRLTGIEVERISKSHQGPIEISLNRAAELVANT
jgi:hypothetical protein